MWGFKILYQTEIVRSMLKHNKYKLLNWSNSIEGLCQHIYRTLKVAHDILQGQLAIGMKHNYKIILIQWSSSYSLTHFSAMVYFQYYSEQKVDYCHIKGNVTWSRWEDKRVLTQLILVIMISSFINFRKWRNLPNLIKRRGSNNRENKKK